MRVFPYKKRRVQHSDDSWADVVSARFPAQDLMFRDIILADYQTRIRDAAHLRHAKALLRGEDNPLIVAWGCLKSDGAATKIFPEINCITESGEHLLSANSLATYTIRTLLTRGWIYWEVGGWHLDIPQTEKIWQERATKILGWLRAENRLWLKTSPHYTPSRADFIDFQAQHNGIPVGRAGFLRRVVDEGRYRAAFNTSYFLLEHDDFFSHHSALGDPYNMVVHQGHIVRPPIYRRATFWCGEDGLWHTNLIGMDNMRLIFPHDPDWQFQFVVNPIDEVEIAVYTRHHGVESRDFVIGHTPTAVGRIEFTVIDRQIVSWQRDGKLAIPQNGFVLSFAPNYLSQDHLENIIRNRSLEYGFSSPHYNGMKKAIQCGPVLIQNGHSVLTADVFTQEQFWISRIIDDEYVVGLVPSDYPTDINMTRAGRVGIGINEKQEIVLVAVSGVNSGFNHQNTDSSGATLFELTNHLLEEGAVEAINLDGGGSSQLFLEGGLVTQSGDRRGLLGITYERMIPSAGVVLSI
jgi:hypothetical protein